MFLDEDCGGTPGAEEQGEAGPGGVGAGFLGEEGGGTAVVDVFVVFGVVVDLLEGSDLVEGVGEGCICRSGGFVCLSERGEGGGVVCMCACAYLGQWRSQGHHSRRPPDCLGLHWSAVDG